MHCLQWSVARFVRIETKQEAEKAQRSLEIDAKVAIARADHAKHLLDLYSHADYEQYRASVTHGGFGTHAKVC